MSGALAAGWASAQETIPTFQDAQVFDVGSFPYGLAAADLIGNDSLPEIVVANGDFDARGCNGPGGPPGPGPNGTVTVLRNTGTWGTNPSGGFVLEQTISICNACVPAEIAVADIDMNNGPDLIVSAAGTNGSGIYVCYNDGTGHFPDVDVAYFETPLPVRGLVARDFDNDGWIDVAAGVDWCVSDPGTDTVYYLFNKGQAAPGDFEFPPIEVDLGTPEDLPPCDIVAADFFRLTLGPPHPDVISANMWSNSSSEVRNLGNRHFNGVTTEKPGGCNGASWQFETIGSGRFDANSFDDFVATDFEDDFIAIFLGNGGGGYTSSCDNPDLRIDVGNSFCWGVDTGQLNGGAKTDIAVTLMDTDIVSLMLGEGDGTFQTPSSSSGYLYSVVPPGGSGSAVNPIMVIITDVDHDGFGDIVTTNLYTDNISVLINELTISPGS